MVAEQKDLTAMVTASSIARQAILDVYGQYTDEEARFTAWVVRAIKKLTQQTLRSKKRYAILTVNKNTRSAVLPCDFREDVVVYVVDSCGNRFDLNINHKIVNTSAFEEIPCEDECDQHCECFPKQMCQDLQTTQQINKIRIGDTDYDETVTATLLPSGEYFVVTTTPFLDIDGGGIIYKDTKEYVTTFDVADCGCIKPTERNICKLENLCPDIWACYCCGSCPNSDNDIGGYKIFIESGIIKFDAGFHFDKAFMEYRGFLPKQGNEYLIPEVSFETVNNLTKFFSVQNKKGVSLGERQWYWDQYEREYTNLKIILGRTSLSDLLNRCLTIPKFSYNIVNCGSSTLCNPVNNNVNIAAVSEITSGVTPATGLPSTGCNPAIITTNGQEMIGGVRYINPALLGVPIRIYANAFNRMMFESEYVRNSDGGFTVLTGVYGLADQFDIFPKWCDANISTTPSVVVVGMFQKSFKVDGVSGSPVAGTFIYQHNDFIGAEIQDITVNKQQETVIDGDFTFDSATGTITRTQVWQPLDTGIANYIK